MAVVHKSTARGYKMGLTEEANKDILKDAKLIGTYCFKIFRKPNGSPLVFYESDEEDISRKDIAMLLMEMDRVKLEVLTEQKADVWMEREDSDQGKMKIWKIPFIALRNLWAKHIAEEIIWSMKRDNLK